MLPAALGGCEEGRDYPAKLEARAFMQMNPVLLSQSLEERELKPCPSDHLFLLLFPAVTCLWETQIPVGGGEGQHEVMWSPWQKAEAECTVDLQGKHITQAPTGARCRAQTIVG